MLANESDPELALLGGDPNADGFNITENKNAPIFTGDAFEAVDLAVFPQRALYGRIIATSTGVQVRSPKLYINTNAPFSGIVCGVQGSGKSHSTSVLLESCLICDKRLGTLPEPLSALLFHFDTAAGSGEVPPCEAAYIGSLDAVRGGDATPPQVIVLVLPSNLPTMQRVYSQLPHVRVEPLHFAPKDISGGRLLAMMKVDQDQQMPLYMECIMSILRAMDTFSYDDFRQQLDEQKFSPTQKAMLNLRLSILDSCLKGGDTSNSVSRYFKQGQLTIVDLSSPFMDGSSACGFFDLILGLFIEAKIEAQGSRNAGKLVVLDEAHKYLTNSESSSRLTDSLLSVIRQQRHLGIRVLISTQEPTVVPEKFLDLCSFVIAHRFSSPKWLHHLKEHISAVDNQWWSKVINLRTGEAMIFSAAGLVLRNVPEEHAASSESPGIEPVEPLGQRYLYVRSRDRITMDGGQSVLAAEHPMHPLVDPASTLPSPGPSAASGPSQEQNYTSQDSQSPPSHTPVTLVATVSIQEVKKLPTITAIPPAAVPVPVRKLAASVPPSIVKSIPASAPEARFRPLISLLQQRDKGERIDFSELGAELKKRHPVPYEGKLKDYLIDAEQAKLVEVGGPIAGQLWVRLPPEPQPCPGEYIPLVTILQELRDNGEVLPMRSIVADRLYKRYPGTVKGSFRSYTLGAEAAGVITYRNDDRIQLANP